MAVDETGNLYVGGNFSCTGGNSASRIARWNGSQWSGLGEGTSGFVQSIVVTDQYLYAGGNFTIAGGQTVNRIALGPVGVHVVTVEQRTLQQCQRYGGRR